MATNKFKSLSSYSFKEPKFNYGFIQANSSFFNRASDFINDEDNPLKERGVIAEKCLYAMEVPCLRNFTDEDKISAYNEAIEDEPVEVQEMYND